MRQFHQVGRDLPDRFPGFLVDAAVSSQVAWIMVGDDLVGGHPKVEILEELAKTAKTRLKELGYVNVSVKAADGYFGWEEKQPFDVIIVTCAAGFVPRPLIDQLKPDGKIIAPLGSPFGTQTLVLINKDKQGQVRSKRLLPVRFVPMVGRIKILPEVR